MFLFWQKQHKYYQFKTTTLGISFEKEIHQCTWSRPWWIAIEYFFICRTLLILLVPIKWRYLGFILYFR